MTRVLPCATSGSVTRRRLILGAGASTLLATAPRRARAGSNPDLLLILPADLHAGYAYTAALAKAACDLVAANRGADALIIVNGDVFESGNAICAGNNGKIDLALLRL